MKLNYTSFFFLLFLLPNLIFAQCIPSAHTFLDANNAKAGLMQGGGLWWNGSDGEYYIPNDGNDISALFAGGIWMGGVDASGNLKVAGNTYGASGGSYDYGTGPLDENGQFDPATCQSWDRFFEVEQTEILLHIADYNDNGQIDNQPPNNILGWPGAGNPNFFDVNGFDLPNGQFAPYFDVNNNGLYEPMEGDYPLTNDATKAIWWVFNDASGVHTETQGDQLRMEIQMMALAYADGNEDLNNTTFYTAKLIYKGFEALNDAQFALWVDADLGCYTDDYVGCLPAENLAFVYNADSIDGDSGCTCQGVNTYCQEIPVTGIKLINGPLDENGNELEMTSFIAYKNAALGGVPVNQGDPGTAQEYYNLMQGKWIDGSPVLDQNGNETSFFYPGNPASVTDWTMCNPQANLADNRMVIGFGPFNMLPGAVNEITFAVVTKLNVAHPCPDITSLSTTSQEMADFFRGLVANESEPIANHPSVSIHPNPFNDIAILDLNDPADQLSKVSIYSLDGKLINHNQNISGSTLVLNKENIGSGMFLYKITTKNGNLRTGKFMTK